jgi:DNA-binding MarR family transcriptional regulator
VPRGGGDVSATSVADAQAVAIGPSILGLARLAELALAETRLSLTQYRVLGHLRQGRTIQSDLAFRLAVTKQSVTRLVDGLVAKKYVTRRADDHDRRRVIHAITPKGERALDQANELIERFLMFVLRDLPGAGDAATVREGIALFGRAMATSRERIRPGILDAAVKRAPR